MYSDTVILGMVFSVPSLTLLFSILPTIPWILPVTGATKLVQRQYRYSLYLAIVGILVSPVGLTTSEFVVNDAGS
ncbi:MAG: hypothetical protein IPJ39_18535 [Saprospiraceae bacterium]|nr:hypothetical protein [Saprospiraceae bacterium]